MKTASHSFWSAFDQLERFDLSSIFDNELERLRSKCLLAATAIEASLIEFWECHIKQDVDSWTTYLLCLNSDVETKENLIEELSKYFDGNFLAAEIPTLVQDLESENPPPIRLLVHLALYWHSASHKEQNLRFSYLTDILEVMKLKKMSKDFRRNIDFNSAIETLEKLKGLRGHFAAPQSPLSSDSNYKIAA
jgi:hypothetical protein